MLEQEPNIIERIPLPPEQTERGRERFNWRKLPIYVFISPAILGLIMFAFAADGIGRVVRSAFRVPKEHPANEYFDMFTAGAGVTGGTLGFATEIGFMAKGLVYLLNHL